MADAPAVRGKPARRTPDQIHRYGEEAWKHTEQWRDIHEDCYEYGMPNRNTYDRITPGEKKNSKAFDSTAIVSAMNAANRIQSDLMPPFQRWAQLKAGPMIPETKVEDINRALEPITKKLFAVVNASNLHTANNEVLQDLMVGTGAMLILEGTPANPVNFVAVPLSQIALEEGPWGAAGGVHRKHKIKLCLLKEQWPDIKLDGELERRITDNPNEELELTECTYKASYDGSTAHPDLWYYDVMAIKDKRILVEREYDGNPWVTPRWTKLAGERFGRGPLIQALPDIKTVNKITEFVLRNALLNIAGVYTAVDDGVLNPNTTKIIPGAMIPVASNGGSRGPSLMALPRAGSLDLSAIQLDEYRANIRRMLFDTQLPPDTGPVRSATEIVERIKQLQRDIGSPFGRLYTEFIVPMLQRVIKIMAKFGIIQPVRVDGLTVMINITSPLAQEQNLNDLQAVIRWLSIMGSFGKELLLVSSEFDEIGVWMADKLGVDSTLVSDEESRKEKRGAMMAAAAMENAKSLPVGTGIAPGQITTAGTAAGIGV